MGKKAAIIGGGPCGLTSARHALLNGFEVEIFDRRSVLGGRWNSSPENLQAPHLQNSTRMQYSADLCAFSDFPPLSNSPNFVMTKENASEYLLSYAKENNLDKMSRLNTEILDVRQHEDYEKNGKWTIKFRESGQEAVNEEVYDVVLVCTGMKQKPWRPNEFRKEREFKSRIINASDFKSTDDYSNKTVVLIGFGNSAAEIARNLGPVAKQIYIAARRSERTLKQLDSTGKPFDLIYNTRIRYFLRSLTPKYLRNYFWESHSSTRFPYLPAPKHRFLATLPVFADGLSGLIKEGKLKFEDNLLSFEENGVEFTSGTKVDNVDEVIFCTGYQFDFSVIEEGFLIGVHHNDFQSYLHMYPVELREYPTLACIGFVQPQLGSVWPLAELQARLFFQVLKGKVELPPVFNMRSDGEWRRCCMNLDFLKTRRHTHIEDFIGFSNELSFLIGSRPSFQLLLSDPILAWHLYTGPLTSYQHRLVGDGVWDGARENIILASKRNASIDWFAIIVFLSIFVLFLALLSRFIIY